MAVGRPADAPVEVLPPAGLTNIEAAARLLAEGRNEIVRRSGTPLLRTVWHQLTDTVILVLLGAATLTAAVKDATDTAVILAVVVLNTTLGVAQELRSNRALDALADLTAPRTTVVRDGREQEIDAGEVVRGDLVRVGAGDVVPADATVLDSQNLRVDEAMITGESIAVDKRAGDPLHAGTVVTLGRGAAAVVATADATAVGRIARSLAGSGAGRTPVQRQLTALGRRLAAATAVAAVAVAVLNLSAGRGLETSVVLAISLAVAAIPESLPAVVSLALAAAARRLSDQGILVRSLPAVEALGSVTVIAADKTGTLTEGRMSVEQLWTPGGNDAAQRDLLAAAALCNDAATGAGGGRRRDDPVEVAIIDAAAAAGIDVAALRAANDRIAEIPFDAAKGRMTTTHRRPDGRVVAICKGSPEVLVGADGRGRTAAHELATAGFRVLAVTGTEAGITTLTGLIGFRDPPRGNAREVVDAFRAAGVRPIMITGDHRDTAEAVAAAVGIDPASVYSRVRPDEKSTIISSLRQRGEVVAMTGDGVNDAPALRAADIGVSMGEKATEVARQAASIVLTRDDLAAMIPAIGEGRRAFDNLRRFLHYALSGGVAEVFVMLVGPFLGFPVPLQAGQLLWVNLLTHGLPGVAMGNEPAAADVLRRPPRPPAEKLLDGHTTRQVGVLSATIALVCLLAGAYAKWAGHPWQSTIFLTLTVSQLAVAIALRPAGAGITRNPMLWGAVVLNLGLAAIAVWWLPMRELLHTESLSLGAVGVGLIAACIPAAVAFAQSHPRAMRAD